MQSRAGSSHHQSVSVGIICLATITYGVGTGQSFQKQWKRGFRRIVRHPGKGVSPRLCIQRSTVPNVSSHCSSFIKIAPSRIRPDFARGRSFRPGNETWAHLFPSERRPLEPVRLMFRKSLLYEEMHPCSRQTASKAPHSSDQAPFITLHDPCQSEQQKTKGKADKMAQQDALFSRFAI